MTVEVIVVWGDVGTDSLIDDVLVDVLSDGFILGDVCIDMSIGVGVIVVVTSAVIDLEFVVSKSRDVKVPIDVRVDSLTSVAADDTTIGRSPGIDVDILAGEDVNVLAAVITALKCIVASPLADSASFCRVACSCWSIADLDCTRALQASIPSCQV